MRERERGREGREGDERRGKRETKRSGVSILRISKPSLMLAEIYFLLGGHPHDIVWNRRKAYSVTPV